MISRRNFLKMVGLTSIALSAGYTTGQLTEKSKSVYYSVHGFIPADEQVIANLVSVFRNKVKSNSQPKVFADSKIGEFIHSCDLQTRTEGFSNSGSITYRLKRLKMKVDSDIIVSDGDNSIYAIDDFNAGLSNIRTSIKNKKAEYFFTAEYNEKDFLSSIFRSNNKEIVIENERGLVERISLEKNYKNILIEGPQGITGLKIEDGVTQIHISTCRHEICKHTIASGVGNIIACAPNKVLVKVELV